MEMLRVGRDLGAYHDEARPKPLTIDDLLMDDFDDRYWRVLSVDPDLDLARKDRGS